MAHPPSEPHAPTQPASQPDEAPMPSPGRGGRAWQQVAATLGWRRPPTASAVLKAAREACTACLADLPATETNALCNLLGHALSLDELWHLRPELYRQLALHHSQTEAERRLAQLNPYFAGARDLHPVAPPSPT